jgi:hypothetical protein
LQENESILISASGDGSIKVWDLAAPPAANPLRSFEEHTHEVGQGAGLLRVDGCGWRGRVCMWEDRAGVALLLSSAHSSDAS